MKVRYESGPYVVVEEGDALPQVLATAREADAVKTFDGIVCYRLLFVGKDTFPRQYPESELKPPEEPTTNDDLPGIFGWIPIP